MWSSIGAGSAAPIVLASTKPLHSIAASVTEGVSAPLLLIDGVSSPHLFQLKPSHIKAISGSDIVLWAGRGVERFIPSMIDNFAPHAASVELALIPGMTHHQSRATAQGFRFDQDQDAPGASVRPSSETLDYHLWFDPENAKRLADTLADELGSIDPPNVDRYRANADSFKHKLEDTLAEIALVMESIKGRPYLIYHDSLQYFEKAFGMGEAIVVTSQPQVQAGAKRIKQLHQQVASLTPGCLLAEVQFQSSALDVLIDELELRRVSIDPVASSFESGAALYTDWLRQTASDIATCLSSSDKE